MVNRFQNANVATSTLRRLIVFVIVFVVLPCLFAADEQKPKLNDATRAKLLAALAAFVILWVLIIVLISLAARLTRRYMKSPVDDRARTIRPPLDPDDWAKTPIVATSDETTDTLGEEK